MASVYLVNALYNKDKPNVPASPAIEPTTEIKSDQPAATVKQPATATAVAQPATRVKQPSTEAQQQSENGGAMHPSRQLMVNCLGPLEEKPEPVVYKVSGANTQPVGQKAPVKAPPAQTRCSKGAMNKPNVIAPEPDASENIQAAQKRSFQAVAASATAAGRSGQRLQTLGGNRIIAGRDPRLRNQAEEDRGAASSPDFVGASRSVGYPVPQTVKQEETAWEAFSAPKLLVPATETASPPQRAETLPFHLMVCRDQLHRPVGPAAAHSDALAVRVKHTESDSASDSEIRIRELEDENLSLRKEGFSKDREIRKLKAELLRWGNRTGSAADLALKVGMKRPRYDEDMPILDGPVGEE